MAIRSRSPRPPGNVPRTALSASTPALAPVIRRVSRPAIAPVVASIVVSIALGGCSADGGDLAGSSSSTSTADATTTTTTTPVATTHETTEPDTAPESAPTTVDPPTTAPERPSLSPEEIAVAFVRDATRGNELSAYVQDPAVATDAGFLDAGPEADDWDFSIDPTYVSPDAQGGDAGECQLVGDVTLQCAVLIAYPPDPATGDPSFSLLAVYVTNIDPNATGPEDPLPPVPYYVVGVEGLAG